MNDEKTIYRLAEPRPKGLLPILFSRFFVIVVLLLIQVALVFSFYSWLGRWLPYFSVITALFTVGGIIYLFNSEMDSTAKLTWMWVISLMPITGVALLAFTQSNLGHRTLQKRSEELITQTIHAVPQPKEAWEKLQNDPDGTDDLVTYLNRSGCFPVFDDTEVTYYPMGEDKWAAMLEELKKAEKFIFFEYFIIEEGLMWGEILRILVEKAAAGVDVRVMYDGLSEVTLLPSNYSELLAQKGIKAKPFAPIQPFISSHYNYRDHRKILVIDGKVAFNGGVNLADEYINKKLLYGHWKDTAVRLKGSAARSFALMFLQMWNITEKQEQFANFIRDTGYRPENPSGYVIPFGDCPLDEDKVGRAVYMDILNRAKKYVHIMTPYLILDDELEFALRYAAQRGVDVKLMLPGIPDKVPPYTLAKSHYARLVRAGVKIYEYTPGFVHAKVFVSDDVKAVVGTINLDYRSLYHHYECGTYLYKADCIPDIERDFQETLTKCRQVTFETIKNEKLSYKIMGSLMKFIAPLM